MPEDEKVPEEFPGPWQDFVNLSLVEQQLRQRLSGGWPLLRRYHHGEESSTALAKEIGADPKEFRQWIAQATEQAEAIILAGTEEPPPAWRFVYALFPEAVDGIPTPDVQEPGWWTPLARWLSNRDKDLVLVRMMYEGGSLEDMAQALGISKPAICQRWERLRKIAAESLAHEVTETNND